MYEVPPGRDGHVELAIRWRWPAVALGLLLLALMGARYVLSVPTVTDLPQETAARLAAWQAARHQETFAYFILLFCILLAARERAWVITALLFVAAGAALIYFELVMRGLAMPWPLPLLPRP